jgi:tyrosinase
LSAAPTRPTKNSNATQAWDQHRCPRGDSVSSTASPPRSAAFAHLKVVPEGLRDVLVPTNMINLDALADSDFTGSADGGSPGFGGVDSGFSHSGQVHGGLETQPHDLVHVLVGGSDVETGLPGVMSDPDTAGLDPIFWLHHANIDRLWEVWRENPSTHVDPMDPNWVNGPAAVGDRVFMLPMPGGVSWTYTPGQMSSLPELGYTYDDLSAPPGTPQLVARLQRLGVNLAMAQKLARSTTMAGSKPAELLGANNQRVSLTGAEARTSVTLDTSVQRKVVNSFGATTAATPSAPDRIFLNLENVRRPQRCNRLQRLHQRARGRGSSQKS